MFNENNISSINFCVWDFWIQSGDNAYFKALEWLRLVEKSFYKKWNESYFDSV